MVCQATSCSICFQKRSVRKESIRQRPPDYHIVHYRTVGHWVPLSGKIPPTETTFNWTTASRGAVYQFRVVGYYDNDRPTHEDEGHLLLDEEESGDYGRGDDEDDEERLRRLTESLPSDEVTVNTGGRH